MIPWLALLVGCPGSSDRVSRDLLLVSESDVGRLLWMERESGEPVASACLDDHFGDYCDGGLCQVWSLLPTVANGMDLLTVPYRRPHGPETRAIGGILKLQLGAPGDVVTDIQWLDFGARLAGIYEGVCDEPSRQAPCRMESPHALACTEDGVYVVADTFLDRLLFLEFARRDDEDIGVVRAVLDATTVDPSFWQDCRGVNNVELVQHEGRELALMTCKGLVEESDVVKHQGHIVLWDVSDLDDIRHLWRYPETGFLRAVHHGAVVDGPEGRLMVYGHSLGATSAADDYEERGSVGVAWFTVDETPTYLGDGVLPEGQEQLGFTRSVTALPDGSGLLVLDSGCERVDDASCENPGRVLEVSWPQLDESGSTGAWSSDHGDQVFFEHGVVSEFGVFEHAYEAQVLAADALGEMLSTEGQVTCDR